MNSGHDQVEETIHGRETLPNSNRLLRDTVGPALHLHEIETALFDAKTDETLAADSNPKTDDSNLGFKHTFGTPVHGSGPLNSLSDAPTILSGDSHENPHPPDLKRVGRYEVVQFLGQGGMGSVYRARDPVLNRDVALKFINKDESGLIRRLLVEGRSQAKVNHPNVCKVYEIGAHEGRPFIAMQFIQGKVLTEAVKGLSLEQKVKIVAEIADALHAAHKEGLIHRDVKPANLLVETTDDGELKPYVMDFGLVRDVSASKLTVTGSLMGTPFYMSPEQARGETDGLDRRTDIHSLGVTLYELLAGKVPFAEGSLMEVLFQVMDKEVPPLRSVDPRIPVDLETIVMKCLEKEPQRRYDTAKALEEDLRRFLAGDPVAGKRSGPLYRFTRLVRKYKVASAVVSAALFVALAASGLGLHALWRAGRQAELSRQFGEQIREIETIMRHGHMLPRHDINREKAMVRDRMRAVEEVMQRLGSVGEGPGRYALARGYMALGEFEEARRQIEQAWNQGYRTPETANAMGIVLGNLFEQRLARIRTLPGAELRKLEQEKAEAELKRPALEALKLGKDAVGESAEYGEALIAKYEQRWDDALAKAAAAGLKIPWLYEARLLRGDVYGFVMSERIGSGDEDGARRAYLDSQAEFLAAGEIGQSDPQIIRELAIMRLKALRAKMNRGLPLAESIREIVEAAEIGLKIDPAQEDFHLIKVQAFTQLALEKARTGGDPTEEFGNAVEASKKAEALAPNSVEVHLQMGNIYRAMAEYQIQAGVDPTQSANNGAAHYRRLLELNPNDRLAHFNAGLLCTAMADYLISAGRDPLPMLDQAVAHHEKTMALWPDYAGAFLNAGNAYWSKAVYLMQTGKDPTAAFGQAAEAYRKTLSLNPKHAGAHANSAGLHSDIAVYKMQKGEDPTEEFDLSIEAFRRALEINPNNSFAYNNFSSVQVAKGQYLAEKGRDPSALYDRADELARKSLEINPKDAVTHMRLGEVFLARGEYLMTKKLDPTDAFRQALGHFKKMQALNPAFSEGFFFEGKIHLLLADWQNNLGRSPETALREAETSFGTSVEKNPEAANALAGLASCRRVRAEWLKSRGKNCLREAEAGLDFIAKSIKVKSDDADSFHLAAQLNALAALNEPDPARRRNKLDEARRACERAASLNKNMETQCLELQVQVSAISNR